MRYFADGNLWALLDGANIHYLCGYGTPVFLSMTFPTQLVLHEEPARLLFSLPASDTYTGSLVMEDFAAMGCYHRQIRTTSPITLPLNIPPYCHSHSFPHLKIEGCPTPALLLRIPAGVPTPDGSCSSKEYRLCIALTGQGHFSADGKEIRLQPGHTSLYFSLCPKGDWTENLAFYLKETAFSSPVGSSLYAARCSATQAPAHLLPNGKTMWQVLTSLCGVGGRVIGGHGENACYAADMAMAGQAFLHLEHIQKAEEIALALMEQLQNRGYIPLCFAADNPYSAKEECGSEAAYYPSIANFFLDLATKTAVFSLKKRLRESAKTLCSLLTRATRICPQLGFSGFEFPMRRHRIPADRVLYANANASAEYIYLLKRLQGAESPLYQNALALYRSDFENNRPPFVENRNRLGRMRLPAVLYATCPACTKIPYTGWLMRGQFGSYLCPACMEAGVKECIETDCPPFPGLFATAAQTLYHAKAKTREELLRTTENALDYCDEKIPFFDLCLLAGVLQRLGSPHYPYLMQQLDLKIKERTFPFYAYEAAAYLLACPQNG